MRRYLLDTNVISELTRPQPERKVASWLRSADESSLFLSVLSLGEIWKSVKLLPQGRKRAALAQRLDRDLFWRFEKRILGIDHAIALVWGELAAERQKTGKPVAVADGLLAATAKHHDLILVTRNIHDFTNSGY